jgi:HEAT repeat protein
MRFALVLALAGLACGCGGDRPIVAGGKPAAHWVRALKDPNAKVRKTAARKLGNIGPGDAAALPALLGALQDADAAVRCEAILALVKFGKEGREALPALDQARQRDPSAQVRAYAARAMEKLRAEAGLGPAP